MSRRNRRRTEKQWLVTSDQWLVTPVASHRPLITSHYSIMAGHSHWSKIKRAKGATDAKRGKIWSKIAKKIMIAAKNGGDPRDNLNLRYTIDEAKAANMPRDTIEKAIKKGTGELGGE